MHGLDTATSLGSSKTLSPLTECLYCFNQDRHNHRRFSADERSAKAVAVDHAIRSVKKADWRGNRFKEREVRNAIKSQLGDNEELVYHIFEIAKAQSEY